MQLATEWYDDGATVAPEKNVWRVDGRQLKARALYVGCNVGKTSRGVDSNNATTGTEKCHYYYY